MHTADSGSENKIRVGVFFGGKSAEHEVSIQSARNVVAALDPAQFTPVLVGIDKTGKWQVIDRDALERADSLDFSASNAEPFYLIPGSQNAAHPIDVALPILHGPMGEDGTIQGFFETAGIPYVGPGVLASAAGMDKDVAKRLLRDAGIKVAAFEVIQAHQTQDIDAAALLARLGPTVFVKPANMGSSVGVSKAVNIEELEKAIQIALQFDTRILVETAIQGDEIECAVLGNLAPKASVIGRIIPKSDAFYSYDAKYVDEDGATLEIPAQIPQEVSKAAQELAVRTFQTLGCEGMARVDMFLTSDNELIVNEVNTIPGFTKISMYPKLWEASGTSYADLITELINLALERHDRRHNLKTSYL